MQNGKQDSCRILHTVSLPADLSPIGQAFLAQELLKMLATSSAAASWNPQGMPEHYPGHIDVFKVHVHGCMRMN